MRLIGSTAFGFAQNMIHDFQNTVLKSKWHCLRQMPQKVYHLSNKYACDVCSVLDLTHSHTMTPFDMSGKESFSKQ